MATKKPIFAKARPKRLGKPKSFNKKSKAYKSAKRKADKKFGKKVSLYKNIFISQAIKKAKRFLCIKTYSFHKLLKSTNLKRKNEFI
jgi:hypothetical protein